MESSPVIDYIKKRIYSHPLRRGLDISTVAFTSCVEFACPNLPYKESKIVLFEMGGRQDRIIRDSHCADCQQEIDKVLPPIETFAQRHWIATNTQIKESLTNDCLLKRNVGKSSDVDFVCSVCEAEHKEEYTGLVRKWMLVREIIGADPGGIIAHMMAFFFSRKMNPSP